MLVGGARLNAVLSSGEPPLAGGRQSSSTMKAKSTLTGVLLPLYYVFSDLLLAFSPSALLFPGSDRNMRSLSAAPFRRS